jgi:hypothetical protein
MMHFQTRKNRARIILALIVGGLSLSCVSQAIVSVGIVPNAATFSYNLAPGAISPVVAVPVTNVPVLLQGVNTTVGNRGSGFVSILRASVAPAFLMWAGLHSQPSSIAQGFSAAAGNLIFFTDFAHQVRVEVASSTSVRVHSVRPAGTPNSVGTLKFIF